PGPPGTRGEDREASRIGPGLARARVAGRRGDRAHPGRHPPRGAGGGPRLSSVPGEARASAGSSPSTARAAGETRMTVQPISLRLRGRRLSWDAVRPRALLMGVVNVTPDSFSDGGLFLDPDAAYHHARALAEEGADILDIGAESTRPGSRPVTADEEWARLRPVLGQLLKDPPCPVSGTVKPEVAEAALALGVQRVAVR